MEALTRLVSESLARHGFDRPIDPRRLQWSRWFRCESTHSLLIVPSRPGIFAIAEEIMDFGAGRASAVSAAAVPSAKRMLAVLQFSEDDDMAFTLDRMFIRINPMRARLSSGNCFLRFVVIEDQDERRAICSALNQWLLSSVEKATAIPAGFSSSLEFAADDARVGRTLMSDNTGRTPSSAGAKQSGHGDNKDLHCAQPLPSGF
ncbi:MAG: hypothetical protein WBV69_07480 [Candidatus Sulfotelmatobacter sp.]